MDDDRDFIGYGADPPDPKWPGGARVAVNINVNFEGGGERSILKGDPASEGALNDIGQPALRASGSRSSSRCSNTVRASAAGGCCACSAASGSRCACWRWPGRRAQPRPHPRFVEDGHEIVSHRYRWLGCQVIPRRSSASRSASASKRWSAWRASAGRLDDRTAERRYEALHLEMSGFLYDRDSLNDELPYWLTLGAGRHLVIPFPSRPTTTASTRTAAFRPATISPGT